MECKNSVEQVDRQTLKLCKICSKWNVKIMYSMLKLKYKKVMHNMSTVKWQSNGQQCWTWYAKEELIEKCKYNAEQDNR